MLLPFELTLAGRKLKLNLELEPETYYSDAVMNTFIHAGQTPEPEVVHTLPHFIRDGDTVIDAGANIGYFAILMSRLVGPTGKVLAVEPDERNVVKLKKNLDINDCTNVEIETRPLNMLPIDHSFFIQDENGSSSMFVPLEGDHGGTNIRVEQRRCTTLTELCSKYVRPSFMKMDIEGAELLAMMGCDFALPAIIAEVNDKALRRANQSADKFVHHMRDIFGYVPHLLRDDGGLPSHISERHRLVFKRPNANLLFLKDWSSTAMGKAYPEIEV